VEVVAVNIDAVLEIPYYTIQLPDGSLKRTNWDNLMTLSEYKKMKSATASADGNGGMGDDSLPRSSSRIRSILDFSSRGRGCRARSLSRSSSRGREGESERERSASRPPSRGTHGGQRRDRSRRSSSKSREGDNDDDDYASDSSRRVSRSTSARGSDSTQGDGGGSTKGHSNGDGSRSHHGRLCSQIRRHEAEAFDDRCDRRSRSTKKHQDPSRPQPRSRSGRSPSHMAARVSMDGGNPCHEEKFTDSNRSRTKDGHQSLVRSGPSLEGNIKKRRDREGDVSASDSNNCLAPLPRSSSDISSERSGDDTAKKRLECATVVVEDVNEDTDDGDYW